MEPRTEIRKRRLGRTDLEVTERGLGAMDTPQVPEGEETLNTALDLGINFVDTAREYEGSEYLIGRAVRSSGGKAFYISTKTMRRERDGAQHDVDRSLGVLGVDSVDLYHLHDVSSADAWNAVMREDGALAGLKIARERGLIRHIGMSSHSLDVLEKAINSGEFDAGMLEYSAFYRETEALLTLARAMDVGVIAMRPLGGSGRMSGVRARTQVPGQQAVLTPATLLRYVLSNSGVSAAIPGARYPSRINDNVEVALTYEPLNEDERRACETAASLF
jgi:aryl-alcohol dehydrogenase-like predicted oxidoreductase